MIRAYTAVADRGSPLPAIPAAYSLYRKAAVKLSTVETQKNGIAFVFRINTSYSFKVFQNIRMVDKSNIDSGLVRIGFIEPALDIVISCSNPAELKVFLKTTEVVQHLTPLKCEWWKTCRSPAYGICTTFSENVFCNRCVGRGSPNFPDCSLGTLKISVTSFQYVKCIEVSCCNLINIAESLGSLPCLEYLDLSHNLLGENANWNFLTSPFIRENLNNLYLTNNGICRFPAGILELKNLHTLWLSSNRLRELPEGLGKLKKLRLLEISNNRLSVLPSCLYRMPRFQHLGTTQNAFSAADINKPQLKPEDFKTIRVPSLFHTVATSIVSKRFPFWEYNMPTKLADYLQSAYRCRCGSIVFPDTAVQVGHCEIRLGIFADNHINDCVPIVIRCCSYKCYRLMDDITVPVQ